MEKITKPKLRIQWVSNAEWSPSGYSNVTKDMYQNFREHGWTPDTFAFIDMYGLMGGKLKDEYGYWHYPVMDHVMGSDAMVHHGNAWKPDIIMSLFDIWPQNPMDLSQLARWIPWAPIDYDPLPKPLANNLRFANRIVSMSKFGHDLLQHNGFASTFIPHGVNTKVFTPLDKAKRKQEMGIDPNTFIFGMVSANKETINPRKSFPQVMDAFQLFLGKHPNSLLYIHTDPDFPGGFPLKQYAEFLGIAPRVAFPDRYKQKYDTSKEDMNLIINMFDCLLSPSMSEGFCIPPIEAMACGVPVIVHDWTAMSELVDDGYNGYKVKPLTKIYYPIGSYLAIPDTLDLYDKMEKMYSANREELGANARKFILKRYDQDKLFAEKWIPFFKRIEDELYPEPLTITP